MTPVTSWAAGPSCGQRLDHRPGAVLPHRRFHPAAMSI